MSLSVDEGAKGAQGTDGPQEYADAFSHLEAFYGCV
jgi:hypothetical protein